METKVASHSKLFSIFFRKKKGLYFQRKKMSSRLTRGSTLRTMMEEVGGSDASSLPPKEKEEEQDTILEFPLRSPRETLRLVARATAPELSIFFCIGFAAVAYFHESHFAHVSIFLGIWLAIQLIFNVLDDDFRNDLFWNVFSLLGNVVFYLFLGVLWAGAKLFLDIWQGHLNAELFARIRTCALTEQEACAIPLLFDMKYMIIQWITTWPASLAYTLSRDPLHIITELLFSWSRQRYFAIMVSAIKAHDMSNSSLDNNGGASWTTLAVWFSYLLAYFVIGYAWTHIKLFIDVWQGALPPSLDSKVRDVYERKASYWDFVKQIKWLVTQWMLTWPLSIVYTLLRHPLRILVDFIYELSQRKYAWIVGKAMETRMKKE